MDLPVLHGMGWSQKYLKVCLGSCDSGLWWLGQASPAVEMIDQSHQVGRVEFQPNLREIHAANSS